MIVRDHEESGLSADEIVRQYPYLSRAEVHAALAYYFDHQDETDREIQEENLLLEEVSQPNAVVNTPHPPRTEPASTGSCEKAWSMRP